MSRAKGIRKPCDQTRARQRLVDARQFLEAAELLDAPDVVATNAIRVDRCGRRDYLLGAGERSADSDHGAAVDLLRQVDASLAAALKRSLDRKTQAAYESDDISNSVALSCVKWAKKLVSGANRRLET